MLRIEIDTEVTMYLNNNQTGSPEQPSIDSDLVDSIYQFCDLASKSGFEFNPNECSPLLDQDGHLIVVFANSKPNGYITIYSRDQGALWHARYEDLEDAELFVDDQPVIKGQTLMQFLDYAGDVVSLFVPANKILLEIKNLIMKVFPNINFLRQINREVYLRVKTNDQDNPSFNLKIISRPMKIDETYLDTISKFADFVESTIDSICAKEKIKLMGNKGTSPVYNIEYLINIPHIDPTNPAPHSAPVEYQHQPGYQQLQSGSLRERFEQRQREKKEQPHPGDLWDQTF